MVGSMKVQKKQRIERDDDKYDDKNYFPHNLYIDKKSSLLSFYLNKIIFV